MARHGQIGRMIVFFDIDDTLLDHTSAERRAAGELARRLVPNERPEAFAHRWHEAAERHFARFLAGELSFQDQRRERMRDLFGATVTDSEADRLFDTYLAAYEASWSLFSDVLECLSGCATMQLGIISNGDAGQQRRKLGVTGIARFFGRVLVSGECGLSKPDSMIFELACSAVRSHPRDTVYVGDRLEDDARAAQRAGMLGVWLDLTGTADRSVTVPVITSLLDLPKLLQSHGLAGPVS